jgi:hypothetical protein
MPKKVDKFKFVLKQLQVVSLWLLHIPHYTLGSASFICLLKLLVFFSQVLYFRVFKVLRLG